MKFYIETDRLILRDILPEDAAGLYELDSDPEVHRYLGNDPVKSMDQVAGVIRFIRQQYIDNGIGRWAIIDKKSGAFIGWTGLKLITEPINNHINYYDLGYRLIRRYWGQGIATESAIASLKYAFETLKTAEVFAMTDIENKDSHNVLTKCGLKLLEQIECYGGMHNWYCITKEIFEQNQTMGKYGKSLEKKYE